MKSKPAYVPPEPDSELYNWPEGQPKPLPESVSIPQSPVQLADDADPPSPLSLQESHARLSLHATKLGERVKLAKAAADEATVLYRSLRDELDELSRGLRALNRVTHPRRRTKP